MQINSSSLTHPPLKLQGRREIDVRPFIFAGEDLEFCCGSAVALLYSLMKRDNGDKKAKKQGHITAKSHEATLQHPGYLLYYWFLDKDVIGFV